METQSYTPEEFSKKLAEELAITGKLAPDSIIHLDMAGNMSDPIGWIMRNTMRIEMARLVFFESVYKKFAQTGQDRRTADLIIAASRAMSASLLRTTILKSAGPDADPARLEMILGVDKGVLAKDLLETHGQVPNNPEQGTATHDSTGAGAQS